MATVTGNEGARWGQEHKKAATVERAAFWRRPQCRHGHAELAAVEQDWVHAHDGEASGERTKSRVNFSMPPGRLKNACSLLSLCHPLLLELLLRVLAYAALSADRCAHR